MLGWSTSTSCSNMVWIFSWEGGCGHGVVVGGGTVVQGMGRPHLMGREGLPIPEVQLIPHHLHPLLCVHGQEGALDPWHVPLVHLAVGVGDMSVLICVRRQSGGLVSAHILGGESKHGMLALTLSGGLEEGWLLLAKWWYPEAGLRGFE